MKITLIALIVVSIILAVMVVRIPKLKAVFKVILPIGILVLSYFLYESIDKPLRFEKEKEARYDAVVAKLQKIRDAQVAYKAVYGKYAKDFDTLIHVMKSDSFPVIKAIGSVPDTLTEQQAVDMGLVRRDTIRVSIKDSLFKDYKIDELRFVPNTDSKEFEMGAGHVVTGSNVTVQVFEAKVHYQVFLKELLADYAQLIYNLIDEAKSIDKYPGLKVGSLEEANNNAGNWE